MFSDLKNKNVIITGGSGFLGSQITEAFLKEQCNVIILDIKKPSNLLEKKIFFRCDIENPKDVFKISNIIKKKFKRIDILINNAAFNPTPKKKKKKIF